MVAESSLRFFGVRHHGPGCARSLAQALAQWQPDCLLIEGPPEADALIAHVADEAMRPPVALLAYCPDEPRRAAFYPFAVFSPDWQALQWAVQRGAPAYDRDLAARLAALGVPSFACTPDAFPGLMAAAIRRDDVAAWAAGRGLVTSRAST